MSARIETLEKKTVMAWRQFIATDEGRAGLDYLRHNFAPKCGAKADVELIRSAIAWDAYQQAILDVESVLTYIPAEIKSAEEPGLER